MGVVINSPYVNRKLKNHELKTRINNQLPWEVWRQRLGGTFTMIGKVAHPEDAAVLCAHYGNGSQIRYRELVVWHEGGEAHSARFSINFVVMQAHERKKEKFG